MDVKEDSVLPEKKEKDKVYLKLCKRDGSTRNGFKIWKGIVSILPEESFSTSPYCDGTGIYFTDLENFFTWAFFFAI